MLKIYFVLFFSFSCNIFRSQDYSSSDALKDQDVNKKQSDEQRLNNLELSITQIRSRLDHLDAAFRQEKNRLKSSEQSFLFNNLSNSFQDREEKSLQKVQENQNQDDYKKISPSLAYESRFVQAKNLFNKNSYGEAFLAFSALHGEYGEHIPHGESLLWMAKSLEALQDYNKARLTFQNYLESYPKSPWKFEAKLGLSKMEINLGFQELGVKHLTEILKDGPNTEAAQSARETLASLKDQD